MRSPVDADSVLTFDTIEPGIHVMRCPSSGGVWIRPLAYWSWREEQQRDRPPELADDQASEALPVVDSPAGKRCPEDGYFLIRHKVGRGLPFHLDRCGHCGGIWLDAGEWRALQQRDLHQDMHLIFTSSWQAQVRAQEQREQAAQRMRQKLGDADWRRISETRAWIHQHPQRHTLEAFLLEGEAEA